MSQSQTNIAAEALVAAYKKYGTEAPRASSPIWRKVITESLGIKKLYTTRLNKILEAAKDMGLEIDGDSFSMKSDDVKESHEDTKPQEEKPKPYTRTKTSAQYMGRLLESEIRGLTARLDDGRTASVTFCVCPHCGKNLKMIGVVEGELDDPEEGDVAE